VPHAAIADLLLGFAWHASLERQGLGLLLHERSDHKRSDLLVNLLAIANKAIKFIVPFPAGSATDNVGRILAQAMGEAMGQSITIENKAGANGILGAEAVKASPADGYTFLVTTSTTQAANVHLYRKLSYDPVKDFEPIGLAVSYNYTLVARKDLPFNNLVELVAYVKTNPNKLSYASAGNGSGQHILAAALWHLAGVELTHIPYRGAQPAYTDLIGGRVDLFFDLASTARVQVDAGTLKALAVSSAVRSPMHPTVPTIRETGVAALELESWFGYFAPARTPAVELNRLRTEFRKVVSAPDVVERFEKAGGKPLALIGDEAKSVLRKDLDRWLPLIKAAGILPE
jgi:tripartite-type tricarboxylate transporter receptor subunit TctC